VPTVSERTAALSTGHRRSARTELVWRLLREALDERVAAVGRSELEVVDAGGGTGNFAVPIAELGHRVTVVDASPDSLAALERRAAEARVSDRIRAVQGDAASLPDLVGAESADLGLCHSVLEFVDSPAAVLTAAASVLRPGAALSVLAANRHAVVLAKAVSGHVTEAQAALVDPAGRWGAADPVPRRFTLDELRELLAAASFGTVATHGIRVFSDLVPGTLADDPAGFDALLELEVTAAEHPAFRALAGQLHLLGRRG
jgi:ubiquinone/menaquinone biosynthesis C-methylase UbiE